MRKPGRKGIEVATKCPVEKRCTELNIGTLLDEVRTAAGSIRQRAYELASERGFAGGQDLDDWLKAENELFFVPVSRLMETGAEYILTASVAGFKPDKIAVCVEPHSVAVWGRASMRPEGWPDAGVGSEAGDRELFCQYRLPHAVAVESAKAVYESEEVIVILPKRSEPREAVAEQPAAA